MNLAEKHALVGDLLIQQLNGKLGSGWLRDGSDLVGPGSLGIQIREHGPELNHVDLGFLLNRDRPDESVVWDCVSGPGDDPHAALTRAIQTWSECTLPVIWEFLEGRGDRASHYPPDDPDGLPGWHCVHGPILAFGHGNQPETMQRWVLDHPLLPQMGTVLSRALDRPLLNGIKLLFGGNIAEVRVNGMEAPEASARLRELAWPRTEPLAFARVFVLAIHPK